MSKQQIEIPRADTVDKPAPRDAARSRGKTAPMLGIVLLVATTGLDRAIAEDEVFTPMHVAKLRFVTDVEISPDGGRVAYILSVPRVPLKEDDGHAWAELHVVTSAGQSRAYVAGQVTVSSLGWSPDGTRISFLAKRGKDEFTGLYAIPADGGESRPVTSHKADISGYAWSPDGRQVAYLATEPLPKEKKELKDKGFSQQIYEEDWRAVRVWIATVDGSAAARALELPGSATDVQWAPDGRQLAVVLAPTPLVDDTMMNKKVHIVDAAGGRVSRVLETPGKLGAIAWSPDSKHLAAISAADRNDPQEGRLWLFSAGDGKSVDVTVGLEGHVTSVAWRDADTAALLADVGTSSRVGTARREDSKWMLRTGEIEGVAAGLSVSRDGRNAAWMVHTDRHPSEVYIQEPGSRAVRRLTNSNPWLTQMKFARQEVVKHKARDGLELEGVLVRPLGAESGKSYPLILAVHGGPEAHVSNGWVTSYSNPGQVAAARGFAVFYPNYRGSTGRGVAFSKLGQADAAGKEFDDLIDAVDHLVSTGLVDKAKVGITGGSYGGYATAWCSTRYSERFAAGVMFVGISNVISKCGTTDIPQEMYDVHHRKHLWDDWSYALERSPIYHVQKARTPLLILHGKDDPRVYPGQSMELYRQLKVLGQTPVRLVFYPGEGHGNRRACARLDYHMRSLQWMEHYLKGPGGSPPPYEFDYGLTAQ